MTLAARCGSKLEHPEWEKLVKLLTLHYSYPLRYPLAGAYFEELFAEAVGGNREERKLLFDVLRGPTGWSLKTLLRATPASAAGFEVVLQRCDILRDRNLSLSDSPEKLGDHILAHFNAFCERAIEVQQVDDPRAAFLIRNRPERRFVFFQQQYELYAPGQLTWQWANDERRSLLAFAEGRLVFRWYRSGTQLFGVYAIPADAAEFEIDWHRADLDETVEFFKRGARNSRRRG